MVKLCERTFLAMDQVTSEDLKLPVPINMIISGASGSGKTTIVEKIILNNEGLFEEKHQSIMYCYGIFNDMVPHLEKMGVICMAGLPTQEKILTQKRPLLLILDDLMEEMSTGDGQKFINVLFTRQSHHNKISAVILAQSVFRIPVVARQSCHVFIFTNAITSISSTKTIATQLFGSTDMRKIMIDALNEVQKEKFGYLLVNVHPRTKPVLTFRTGIFPGEVQSIYH